MVAHALDDEGLATVVAPCSDAPPVEGFDVVVVGGALYASRWHRDARRYVRSHADELRGVPTYLFSSGPLDGSAADVVIPPVKGVERLMERIGAKGHVTFGGRLAPDAKGVVAHAMAKKRAGDWREARALLGARHHRRASTVPEARTGRARPV
jgi:menaquinone-dependent protoporphyrinogen oxidase